MYYYSPFRKEYAIKQDDGSCPFCNTETINAETVMYPDNTPVENDTYRWTISWFPKFEGHTMVVPKRHITQLGEETPEEIVARESLVTYAARVLRTLYPGAGVEYFLQTGPGSASSVRHLHWHVVPAQPDDTLRGFDKLGHFHTTEPEEEKVVVFPQEITLAREELQRALADTIGKM